MPVNYSPLRYPGGKSKLYNYVKPILQENNLIGETYIEPFAGGSGLAIKLLLKGDVKRIVLNDYDPAIYKFWYCVLNETDELCNFINNVDVSLEEWDIQKQIYLHQNEYANIDVAKATFFLNRTNVSGIIKGGMIGGRTQNSNYGINARFNRNDLVSKIRTIAQYSKKIDLYNLDAKEFIKPEILHHYYKVFINFDPPYVEKGGQLYKNSFSEQDHKDLFNAIKHCNRKWMVTYDVNELIKELYKDYRGTEITLNYYAKTVRKAQELAYFSNNLVLPDNIVL